MSRPFSVSLASPTRAALRRPWPWILAALVVALAIGGAKLVSDSRANALPPGAAATLVVTSTPVGATILIGDRERGRTPATVALPPGEARVTLRLDRHADVTYRIALNPGGAASLAGILWPRTPSVAAVRPPLPGATIAGARFLADGRLALTVAIPPGDERQLWLADGAGGARRVGPPVAQVAIAASPDGERVAYLARPIASPGIPGAEARVAEVWVTARDGDRGERRYSLPPNTADERLVDLSWAPDSAALLLVSQQRPQGGGIRSRLQRLDLAEPAGPDTDTPRELISMPSEIVPDSFAWSPRGDRVALLARSDGRTALCVVGLDGGLFRSLADVGDTSGPPTFPPLAWAASDAGVIYAAPDPSDAGTGVGLFGAVRPADLVADDLTGVPPRRIGELAGPGPCPRGDGLLVALAQPKARAPVSARAIDPAADGFDQDLGPLPQLPGSLGSVRWSGDCGQALVAIRNTAGGDRPDLWLVRWAASGGEVAR
jgi:hypothetical protein